MNDTPNMIRLAVTEACTNAGAPSGPRSRRAVRAASGKIVAMFQAAQPLTDDERAAVAQFIKTGWRPGAETYERAALNSAMCKLEGR